MFTLRWENFIFMFFFSDSIPYSDLLFYLFILFDRRIYDLVESFNRDKEIIYLIIGTDTILQNEINKSFDLFKRIFVR